MNPTYLLSAVALFLGACSQTVPGAASGPLPSEATAAGAAVDSTYGYTEANPIKVGGFKEERRAQNQHDYLRALRGPEGQPIRYRRLGSCCAFDTPNGFMGRGLLDVYEVTYDGLAEPVQLYLSLYDYERPRAPAGFIFMGRSPAIPAA
jgi:hypothetical protein